MSRIMSKIIFDTATTQILEWRSGPKGSNGVLIAPPDAGHGDGILNYAPGKSIVEQALNNTKGGVYSIRWKSANWFTRNTSLDDKVSTVHGAMCLTNARNLIGLCQAGTLGSLVATRHPEAIVSLTIAGAPIDTSLGESILAQAMDMKFSDYQKVVMANWGIMPGWLMLACWKSANKEMHYHDRYIHPTEDTDLFYGWYDKHQNLAGRWYLEVIKQVFLENTFKDQLNIQCPVNIALGDHDDITPNEQTLAIQNYMASDLYRKIYRCDAGHLGVFLARSSMGMWAKIFKDMNI